MGSTRIVGVNSLTAEGGRSGSTSLPAEIVEKIASQNKRLTTLDWPLEEAKIYPAGCAGTPPRNTENATSPRSTDRNVGNVRNARNVSDTGNATNTDNARSTENAGNI